MYIVLNALYFLQTVIISMINHGLALTAPDKCIVYVFQISGWGLPL